MKNQTECKKWIERDNKVISTCSHLSYFPLVIEKVEGSTITDADGNEYIDFLSSASSLNLGGQHPAIHKVVREQIEKCTQFTAAYTYNKPMIEYAEKLTSLFPGGKDIKICFGNCGSDGNDAAIKFSRAFTGRTKIITFINSYHGNTYGSSTLSACSVKMSRKMGPFIPEVYHFPFVDDSQNPAEPNEMLKQAFNTYLHPDDIAAVIIEPIQGDGGMLPANRRFIEELYAICKEHGILFISEEVQVGFHRSGPFFAIENYDIIPDGIIMGKSIGGGFTLGAFMARAEIIDLLPPPAHLFTLGASHIACAAGLAEVNYMQTDEFKSILNENMKIMKESLEKLKASHKIIKCCRGLGMSMGIVIEDTILGKPASEAAFKIVYRCYELGLIVITIAGDTLRIQPPLVIEHDKLKKAFSIIDEAMTDYENNRISDDVLENSKGW